MIGSEYDAPSTFEYLNPGVQAIALACQRAEREPTAVSLVIATSPTMFLGARVAPHHHEVAKAAQECGLLHSDAEFDNDLALAAGIASPRQVHELFVISQPDVLLEKYLDAMSEDICFANYASQVTNPIWQEVLNVVESILYHDGFSLAAFLGLPQVVKVNNMVLDVFRGEVMEYFSFDAIPPSKVDNESLYPTEFLNTIDDATMPLHKLRLKIGCIYPVRLAFAMTIKKSQGQTLNTVGLYLPNPLFTHGQLYVAL
ncbi:uncharacterized protein LOC144702044 [Wolffia australiana]